MKADASGEDTENIYVCDAERNVLKINKNVLLQDEKPEIIEIPDATTSSIAWYGENICFGYRKVDFIVGSEQQMVGRAKKGNFEAGDIIDPLEFQMDVTTVDANRENVIGGSSDYAVKCTNMKDLDAELKTRSLEAEVLCVKLDPKNEFVAVSTVDGNVTIIDIDSFSIKHTLTKVFPRFETIDVSRPRIQLSWSKDGQWLFVPSKGCVKSYRRNGWEESGVYRLKDHASVDFSVTALSPCGKYLASSTMDNQIAVWNSDELDIVCCEKFVRNAPGITIITSIVFSPFSPKKLIVADSNRGICLFNVFKDDSSNEKPVSNKTEDVAVDSDDDDSILLNRTSLKKDSLFNEEAIEEDEDTRMSSDLGAIKRQFNYGNQDLGGLEEFGFKLGEPEEMRPMSSDRNLNDPLPQVYSDPPAPRKVLIPERFVSNSSPMDLDATQRFLKYNRFGIIRSYVNEANKVSTIDIEFHNKSIHGDIHIDNFEINYELADISLKVVALASVESRKKEKELDKANDDIEDLETDEPAKTEKKGTSLLHVIPIQAFDSQRWSMVLPRGDGCIDVLCSNTQVVVLTKKRNIRVFTIGGIQRQIFTHFAPILTAACFEDRLAIASVCGSEFYEQKKTPQWRFEVVEYTLNPKSWYRENRHHGSTGAVSRIDVPIETGEQLDWIAYSNQGKLAVMDSAYTVHVLSAPGLWIPIFQGSSALRAPSDAIFPIGLTVKEFRYIYCRGSRSPLVNGINAPTTVEFKVPFCQPESHRTEMEHEMFLKELSLADAILERNGDSHVEEAKTLTKTIVKLFAWLTKTNSDGQAAEVAALVSGGTSASAKAIQSLCNYASKCKKVALAEKVAEIGRRLTEDDDDRSCNDTEIWPTKRIALAARKAQKAPSPTVESLNEDQTNDGDESSSRYNLNMDVSMMSQPVQPLERLAKNPFAKGSDTSKIDSAASSQASLSIFDQLESTSNDQRKRAREPETVTSTNQTVRKQAKLNFGGTQQSDEKKKKTSSKNSDLGQKGKENEAETLCPIEEPAKKSVSPYEMWLTESKSSLEFDFDGDNADFSKFCIQTFRALSKNEKEEWKAKALTAAAQD